MKIRSIIILFVIPLFFMSCGSSLLNMVEVEGGTYTMGTDDGERNEKPAHQVQVNSFSISATEITQAQWTEVMGENPVGPDAMLGYGDNIPVYLVSWEDATNFCNALSIREKLTPCYSGTGGGIKCDFSANGYRLPTEAEWEFAARGGNSSTGTLYSGSDDIDAVAWYAGNTETNQEVAQKAPNELGIYDMSGNVWEWVWDYYDANFYGKSDSENPTGPDSGIYRTLRGGSRGINEKGVTVYHRYYGAHRSDDSTGFRVVRTSK